MSDRNYFKSVRWNAGIGNTMEDVLGAAKESVSAEFDAALNDPSGAVFEPVANRALSYYDKRIRAHFAKHGIDIGDDILTVESIREKVEASTGLQISELTAEGVLEALERPLAKSVSELLGFAVTKVFDRVEFELQVREHVKRRLIDGEGGGVLTGQVLHDLRDAATWNQAGLSSSERRRILNRAYQRKYRKEHAQTWV